MPVFTSGHGHNFPSFSSYSYPYGSIWQLCAMAQQFCMTTWHRA